MAKRPTLFTAAMVQAILREIRSPGTGKTQTRRLLKLKGYPGFHQFGISDTPGYDWTFRRADWVWEDFRNAELLQRLPVQAGDRLWVRETWSDVNWNGAPAIGFKADGTVIDLMENQTFLCEDESFNYDDPRLLFGRKKEPLGFATWTYDLIRGVEGSWVPSIHMPRWVSRITLDVTDVRVERLQDISDMDPIHEGIEQLNRPNWHHDRRWRDYSGETEFLDDHRESFRTLWNSINGTPRKPDGPDISWDANPWVMAITFTPHLCNIDQMPLAA